MAIKISTKDAKRFGLDPDQIRNGLLDPLLRTPGVAPAPRKSTAHKTPKIARRVSDRKGPEGTGRLWRASSGAVVGIALDLELLPVPKERARVVKLPGQKTVSYTPARTKRFTQDVVAVLESVMGPVGPIEGPVRLDMVFTMPVPPSWPKWKQNAALVGAIAPTARPDMDNLEKALLDALNGRAFIDDAFVVERMAKKVFGAVAGIHITVEKIQHLAAQTATRKEIEICLKDMDQ